MKKCWVDINEDLENPKWVKARVISQDSKSNDFTVIYRDPSWKADPRVKKTREFMGVFVAFVKPESLKFRLPESDRLARWPKARTIFFGFGIYFIYLFKVLPYAPELWIQYVILALTCIFMVQSFWSIDKKIKAELQQKKILDAFKETLKALREEKNEF